MLAHITPRGISALPGPVVKLLGQLYSFNPRYACAYHPEGYLGPTRTGRKVARQLYSLYHESSDE